LSSSLSVQHLKCTVGSARERLARG
jgi:hypothetical protein